MRCAAVSLRLRRQAGFSLLETLIAMAILALGATVVLARSSGAVAQVADHATFFDFQRAVSDVRRDAWRAQAPVVIMEKPKGPDPDSSPGADDDKVQPPADGAQMLTVDLKPGWSYALSQPLRIEASGRCRNIAVDLLHDGKPRVHLISQDDACHFTRTVAKAD